MSYIYKNITDKTHLIAVVNEARTDVSHIPLSPGARIEVAESTLDVYLPHILARMSSDGSQDITHQILRQNEDIKKIAIVEEKKRNSKSLSAPVEPVVKKSTVLDSDAVLPKLSYADSIASLPPVIIPEGKPVKSKKG